MEKEVFKGQYALCVTLVVCSMIFMNIVFKASVPYAVKVALCAAMLVINGVLLYKAGRVKDRKLTRLFGLTLVLVILITVGGLFLLPT